MAGIIISSSITVLIAIGIIMLLGIDFLADEKEITISFLAESAKSKRSRINIPQKLNKYQRVSIKVKELLKKAGKDIKYLYMLISVCFTVGCLVGFICFNGMFLALATGITFMPISYLYLLFKTQEAVREETAELENAMSVITNAYLSNNDIIRSIELYIDEKNRYLDEALRKTGPFEEFIAETILITSYTDLILERLRAKINNKYFDQWVKNLRLCLISKDMRFSLQPVIDSMADEKIMQLESDTAMKKTWAGFLSAVAVMFAVILVFRIARREWYLILVDTFIGKIIVVMMLVSAIISSVYVMRINKPLSTLE